MVSFYGDQLLYFCPLYLFGAKVMLKRALWSRGIDSDDHWFSMLLDELCLQTLHYLTPPPVTCVCVWVCQHLNTLCKKFHLLDQSRNLLAGIMLNMSYLDRHYGHQKRVFWSWGIDSDDDWFSMLPDELCLQTLHYLTSPPGDLCTSMRVCQRLNTLCKNTSPGPE